MNHPYSAYIGQITQYAFDFVPDGWLPCNGQPLDINTYSLLYTLIGTTFGGDGVATFNAPNLQGRAVVGTGQAPNMQNYYIGQPIGDVQVTITQNNLPMHTHTIKLQIPVNNAGGTTNMPKDNIVAAVSDGSTQLYGTPAADVMAVGTGTVTAAGGNSKPVDIRNPFLAMTYCICWNGIFPSQP